MVCAKSGKEIDILGENNDIIHCTGGEYDLPLTDGEIIVGILKDISQNKEYYKIVAHVIAYILNKNKISKLSCCGVIAIVKEDGKLYIYEQ